MLDNLTGSNDNLEAFEAALYGSEPEESEPTEEVEAVELSDEAEEVEAETEEPEAEEVEEEPEESEDAEEDEEEQAAYEITVNGETQEVTLDELLSGYQRQADYTRKTQTVAEDRKSLEAKQAEVLSLAEGLEASKTKLSELIQQADSAIDWDELRDTDPSEYLKQKELQDQRKNALKEAEAQQQAIKQQKVTEEIQKLYEKLPTWQDPKQREADIGKVQGYLSEIGYQENEFQETDHRLMLALLDAAKYREMQSQATKVVKKVKKAPQVTKPGKKASKADIDARARKEKIQRLRSSGSEEDALEVFKMFV